MRRNLWWVLLLGLSLTALQAGKGKIRVASDHQGAFVYVDGKKKAMTGEGFTSILLEEGEYTIKVANVVSEQYETSVSKRVFVGADTSVKITLNPKENAPTQAYAKVLKTLDKPKYERWQRSGEIVTDIKLGLMWQDNSKAKSVKKKWKGAMKYCKNLSFGGYNDWRLPNYDELLTIVDYDRCQPVIVPTFQNVVSDGYWPSSVYEFDSKDAWFVGFHNGRTDRNRKFHELYVRCVRGRQ